MIRPDLFLLGYRVFTVKKENVGLAAEILLKSNVSVKFVDNKFVASERKSRKITKLLAPRVEFSQSELLGMFGFVLNNRRRWGVFLALCLTALMFFFFGGRVWDVRIDGCSDEAKEKITDELAECGFAVGTRWSKISLSDVEVNFLSDSDVASWVNINRRGTVAYVTVIEKISHPLPEQKTGYANVVATADAVIEEITVMKGVAAVKAGDVVKKGDLLISGIISNEFGTEFCYAEGTVIGRISDSLSLTVSDTEIKKQEKEKRLTKFTLKFFNFPLNILNTSRNSGNECDIIEEKKTFTVLGKGLPFYVYKQYSVEYESVSVKLSAAEMSTVAAEKMSSALEKKLANATLVRIRTEGSFSENSYTVKSSVVYLEKIGEDLSFDLAKP